MITSGGRDTLGVDVGALLRTVREGRMEVMETVLIVVVGQALGWIYPRLSSSSSLSHLVEEERNVIHRSEYTTEVVVEECL